MRQNGSERELGPDDALRLGQWVSFDAHLYRQVQSGERYTTKKTWSRMPIGGCGVVVGLRTLQDGFTVWGSGGDDPSVWRRTGSVPAVLVALSLHTKPMVVHRDDVAPIAAPAPDSVLLAEFGSGPQPKELDNEKDLGAEPWEYALRYPRKILGSDIVQWPERESAEAYLRGRDHDRAVAPVLVRRVPASEWEVAP